LKKSEPVALIFLLCAFYCMIMLMEQLIISGILTILGLVLGSFAGATVWRLRARQLIEDKAEGEKVDKKELKMLEPLAKVRLAEDRSHCLHCNHRLAWYDLIPLASWVSTRGKCRYCHEKIGWFEPVIELGLAAFFVISYLLWPAGPQTLPHVGMLVLWLLAGVLLAILFAYDLMWSILPNKAMFPLIGIATLVAVFNVVSSLDMTGTLVSLVIATVLLSGLYFILWLISKGQWIGFGDVKLGLALALLLGDWKLAFLALFAANLIGCLIVVPGMLIGKLTRKTRVPFGPLLILGAVAAMWWGAPVLAWYFSTFL
jgi:leader peptidase (prepilin peptidase)/N-methyltransferase